MAESISKKEDNFSDWYVQIVTRAQLADYSPVKGTMVIRPRGYAIWEHMQRELDDRLKKTNHQNAYFPFFIPQSFITKEEEHVKGFSPELAVVTHGGGEKLEEPLIARPTSETIIWSMYKKWIQSYRDLPLLINQWANVIRWEKRTRLFLRTTEFLWQEGHTAHETKEEAKTETQTILSLYKEFAENILSLPVIHGKKTEQEKFAGAVDTYAIEVLLQDGKSLQAGTSHFLGQNFAKAFDVTYQARDLSLHHVWASSWGVSTRLVGAVIMMHSDNKGLIVPPKIAPTHVVIIPIYKKNTDKHAIRTAANNIREHLASQYSVVLDDDENNSPGWKFSEWELRGACLRIEIGPKDVEKKHAVCVRRDTGEKQNIAWGDISHYVSHTLNTMQEDLLKKAKKFREDNTHRVKIFEEFISLIEKPLPGYIIAPWDGTTKTEIAIKEKTKASIRILTDETPFPSTSCIYSKAPAKHIAIFAKAY